MSTDFRDASARHFDDAEVLIAHSQRREANADHLFGLSAECSLKAVMLGLGMAVKPDGAPADQAHKVHMPQLWAAFQSFAKGRLASRYLEPLDKQNPFADWDVEQRYWSRVAVLTTATSSHRRGAVQCRASLEKLTLDGVSS
jgi:hypothetical protein